MLKLELTLAIIFDNSIQFDAVRIVLGTCAPTQNHVNRRAVETFIVTEGI